MRRSVTCQPAAEVILCVADQKVCVSITDCKPLVLKAYMNGNECLLPIMCFNNSEMERS